MREVKLFRDPYDEGRPLFSYASVSIRQGFTVLVGCNGAGKTTILRTLRDVNDSENIPTIYFDNLRDGGSHARSSAIHRGDMEFAFASMQSSEGENILLNLGNVAARIGSFIRDCSAGSSAGSSGIWVLLDAVDSGLGIDNVINFKSFLKDVVLKDAEKYSVPVYIVVSSNSFEMAHGENCLDVSCGGYRSFADYAEFREFILDSRKLKESRDS